MNASSTPTPTHMQPLAALTKSDVLEELGPDRLYGDIELALTAAEGLVRQPATKAAR